MIVTGIGGVTTGNTNPGIFLSGAGSTITSAGGNVSVTGTGGGSGASTTNVGIRVVAAGTITAGSSGTVTVNGTGGTTTGNTNYGVYVTGTSSTITSSGGNVSVTGLGGGSVASSDNYGVYVSTGIATITSGSNGNVSVTGTGGNASGTGGNNRGIYMDASGKITSGGSGTVTVQGTGSNTSGSGNQGIELTGANTTITSGGGNVSVTGLGAGNSTSAYNYGISLNINSVITSGGNGTVGVTGTGGNSSGSGINNRGIYIREGSQITSGGSGNVTVQGTGSTSSGDENNGIHLYGFDATVQITSGGGNVAVTGIGGGSATSYGNDGIEMTFNNSTISAGGNGNVNVTGTGGNASGTGNANYGIFLDGTAQIAATGSGTITVNGTGGASSGTVNHGMLLGNATITSAGGGTINVTGTKGANSTNAYDIELAGGTITATSIFSPINITCTTGGLKPEAANTTDASTGSSYTTTFTAGSKLNIRIIGPTINFQYSQFNVVGLLNLNSATLTFNNSTYTPLAGETYTIVTNDGTDAITGTFSGLAEGATITNFLSSGLNATITYVGGTGNDVVLTVVAAAITWDGSSSTDWNTAANWSNNAVPTATDDVVIPNLGNDPVISGAFTINNIDLQSGTPLTVASGGSLTLDGTLSNAGSVTIQSGGSFLQGSSSSITGAGTFTVQRQGTSSSTKFNYWSTPIAGGTLPGSNGYSYSSAAGTNSNADDNPGPDPGWSGFSGSMTTGRGYASNGGNLASFTGTPGNGTINVGVSYYGLSPTSTSAGSDFVLLGNPYPSGLTVSTFLTDNAARLSGQLWAWDDDNTGGTGYATGDYASRTSGGSTSGGNGNSISTQIAVAQGFMAKVTAAGSVTFNNAQRNAAAGTFLKTEEEAQRIWISLNNETNYNEINVVFMEDATEEYDRALDGQKLRGNPNMALAVKPAYSNAQEDELCIAALPPVTEETIVQLSAHVVAEGTYTLKNKATENMDNMEVYLEDRLLNIFTDLSNNGEYSAFIAAGENTQRFFLHFAPQATGIDVPQQEAGITAFRNGSEIIVIPTTVTPSVVEGQLSLYDITGKLISTQQVVNSQGAVHKISVEGLAQGMYVISLQTVNNTYSNKIVIQ